MPEGPSLVIFKEAVASFAGKKILRASGNARINMDRLHCQKILAIRTWGKQFFICLRETTIRVHFLMFGSHSIGEQTKPAKSLRLALVFSKNANYFYTCSVKLIELVTTEYNMVGVSGINKDTLSVITRSPCASI